MSDFDDFDDSEAGEDGAASDAGGSEQLPGASAPSACLSCGAPTVGVFCANCGQKNDDLRRSLIFLARDFIEDTFSFDSRMWRTLGALVAAPGLVPTNYAHGKRSRYTPPVRLFLIVSFLFFLLLSVTQTLFVAIKVGEADPGSNASLWLKKSDEAQVGGVVAGALDCDINASLSFFVRVSELDNDYERWAKCIDELSTAAESEIAKAQAETGADGVAALTEDEAGKLTAIFSEIAKGVSRAVEDPESFNAAFNYWLPRVMFLMTPVLAIILGLFIRGRDGLFFDHVVLSLYSHAVGFVLVGAAIVAAQAGVPVAGAAASAALLVYLALALKRAYGRGWIKTIYTAFMAGLLYQMILVTVVIAIVTNVVLQS